MCDFQEEPKWFDQDLKSNTKVYVSNLPSDLTELEFAEFMQKCGIIMKDVDTGKIKLKLYADSEGNLKGDGLCTYIKVGKLPIFSSIFFIWPYILHFVFKYLN